MTGQVQISILDNHLGEATFEGLHVVFMVGRNKPKKTAGKENLANHSPYVVTVSTPMLVCFCERPL